MVYKIDLLNSICTDNLGGTGGHVQNITALNEWCVLAGGTGAHRFEISAYNELSVLYGGTGGYKYDIDALNEICVSSGGTGGHRFAVDALVELGALLNQIPLVARDANGEIITPVEYSIDNIDYLAYIFNADGTLEVKSDCDVDYLIVAGGGGGGGSNWLATASGGGGGGAGGVLQASDYQLLKNTYDIIIGAGGVGGKYGVRDSSNGGNSTAFGLTAIGGGKGATQGITNNGAFGGSGGGARALSNLGGAGTTNQGNDGANSNSTSQCGGGGGAGGAAVLPAIDAGGDGGNGIESNISGQVLQYAGGGGGGGFDYNGGIGKARGGNAGTLSNRNGINAEANSGSGGGGTCGQNGAGTEIQGGDGGSGIVIVRYKKKINPFNIILVAGQSNTDGRVATSDVNAPAYLSDNIVNAVKVWNGTSIVDYDLTDIGQSGNGSSWILSQTSGNYSFAHVALKKIAETLENVVVCQVTSGGTPLAAVWNERGSWNANYAAIPGGTPRLTEALENRFADLISYCELNSIPYNVIALLWHQGETDDDSWLNEEDEYAANFTALISKIRTFTNSPNLKIVYGTVPASSLAASSIIRNAHLNFAANDSNAYCRDNDDLTLFDSYHFNAQSCNTFGEWAANQI